MLDEEGADRAGAIATVVVGLASRGKNSIGPTVRHAFEGSSFQLSAGGENDTAGWTTWGRVATGGFEGVEDDTRLDGKVTSAFLGADVERGRWLGGLAFGTSKGKSEFSLVDGTAPGTVETTVKALYPYARMKATSTLEFWDLAGFGAGNLMLKTDDGQRFKTEFDMTMGAIRASGDLLSPSRAEDLAVCLKADAQWVRTTSDGARSQTGDLGASRSDTSRTRLAIETSRTMGVGGGKFTPSAELGLRYHVGDAETGAGLEAGGALA
ncbi:MAG: autotransporter domain-containing protein [Alphaproteobacteria bacterium]|nr:autotransporter domain-containing protein [Alphaproteobacteria bacterium]